MISNTIVGPRHFGGVALAGFMGSGKSTVGAELARRLDWRFVDLDLVVESRSGCTVHALFESVGEPGFRTIEHESLGSVLTDLREPVVLALGGGALLDPASLEMVQNSGLKVVVLNVTLVTALERVRGSQRPLAPHLASLFRARAQHYASLGPQVAADTAAIHSVADAVMELL